MRALQRADLGYRGCLARNRSHALHL